MVNIAKLTAQYEYRADKSKHLKAYKLTLAKVPTENAGFTKDTECQIEYKKDKIIITKK